jgi:hypothetical protein
MTKRLLYVSGGQGGTGGQFACLLASALIVGMEGCVDLLAGSPLAFNAT